MILKRQKAFGSPTDQPAINHPSKEEILSGIENPEPTKNNLLPEIYPEPTLPSPSASAPARSILTKQEPYHENISPVKNIVQTKMTEPVVVPKETIVVQEQSKLPEKNKPSDSTDPYREPVI